jgi:hypothetical protein
VEIAFETKSLRTLCESEAQATKELGPKVAPLLIHRLADLRAARFVSDIPVGNPRELTGDPTKMVIDLCDGYFVIFSANQSKMPVSEQVDWLSVNRIKVIEVVRSDG